MKENVLELVQVVYQEKDRNISIIREIYEVAKNKQGGQPRHYGKTGQIRRVSNKTYYIKVRAVYYNYNNATYYYGKWSRIKKTKIK